MLLKPESEYLEFYSNHLDRIQQHVILSFQDFSNCGSKKTDSGILPWKKLSIFLDELTPQLKSLRFEVVTTDVLEYILSNHHCKHLEALSVKLLTTTEPYPGSGYPQ